MHKNKLPKKKNKKNTYKLTNIIHCRKKQKKKITKNKNKNQIVQQ